MDGRVDLLMDRPTFEHKRNSLDVDVDEDMDVWKILYVAFNGFSEHFF